MELGEQYKHLSINPYSIHGIGVDIGFGSSNTAVIGTEFLKEEAKIRVVFSQEWEHGDPSSYSQSHIPTLLAIRDRQHFHIR